MNAQEGKVTPVGILLEVNIYYNHAACNAVQNPYMSMASHYYSRPRKADRTDSKPNAAAPQL